MRQNTKGNSGARADVAQALARGRALDQAGRVADAVRICKGILSTAARQPQARTQLGIIALNEGDNEAALAHFEKAAGANPKSAAMRNNVATVHVRRLEFHKAIPHLKKALALEPNLLVALRNLGECLFMLNDLDGARTWLQKALSVVPGDAGILFDIGRLERACGNMAVAEQIYRDLIGRGEQVPRAYSGLAATRRFAKDDPELDDIEARLGADDLTRQDRQTFSFSAGKMAADRAEYDRAFGHFTTANANYPGNFDLDNFAAYVEAVKATITPQFMAERADFGSSSDRPVFIFGMPRSGTSLVEQILASHPDADGADELPFFSAVARQRGLTARAPGVFGQFASALTRRDFRRLGRDYLDVLAHHSRSAKRVSDKLPHNFQRLWLLALTFPDATFIHCRRNPVANCLSCYINPLNEQHLYATDLTMLGSYYRHYRTLMDHWRAVLPVNMLECDYEALVTDPEKMSRQLIAHAGLPWDDKCLNFHENRRAVRTLSVLQVRQPVYKTSVEGWRRYDKYLQPLKLALGDLYDEEAPGVAGGRSQERS